MTTQDNLAGFIRSHGFEPTLNSDGVSVTFFIPAYGRDGSVDYEMEQVASFTEARNALGY